jgi:hypothetical protein
MLRRVEKETIMSVFFLKNFCKSSFLVHEEYYKLICFPRYGRASFLNSHSYPEPFIHTWSTIVVLNIHVLCSQHNQCLNVRVIPLTMTAIIDNDITTATLHLNHSLIIRTSRNHLHHLLLRIVDQFTKQ